MELKYLSDGNKQLCRSILFSNAYMCSVEIKLMSQLVINCQTNLNLAYLESLLMKSNANGRTPFT